MFASKQNRVFEVGSGVPSTASTAEAAFVTGLSPKAINRLIDRGEIRTCRSYRRQAEVRSARELCAPELVYLVLWRDLGTSLSGEAREALYKRLCSTVLAYLGTDRSSKSVAPDPVEVRPGLLWVDWVRALEEVQERHAELARARDAVVLDPAIRGREPVVRGTRVPVYRLADLKEQGASEEELLEDYPALSRDLLRQALVWAETHPRRGRPQESPALDP